MVFRLLRSIDNYEIEIVITLACVKGGSSLARFLGLSAPWNAILFVLVGLELLILDIRSEYAVASLVAIVIVLTARYVSLKIPVRFFAKRLNFAPRTATMMTWGGLRGGISIALALSLPPEANRALLLTVTYIVVVFSIIVQGLTLGKLANAFIGGASLVVDSDPSLPRKLSE